MVLVNHSEAKRGISWHKKDSFPEKKFWTLQYDTVLKISHTTPNPSIPSTPSYKEGPAQKT
jgi:hypothetical protein